MPGWSQLSTCLLLTLLHSIWQSGLLYLFFQVAKKLLGLNNPATERKSLLFLLLSQLIVSVSGFVSVYNETTSSGTDLSSQWINGMITMDRSRILISILAAVYILILTIKIFQIIRSWMGFRQLVSLPKLKAPIDLRLFTQRTSQHLGIRKEVSLWLSDHIGSPMTYGFFKPVILLPFTLVNQISLQEAEALILHELSHIKRHDYLVNWIILIMEQLFFFNPFTRLLTKKFRESREFSCDLQVLQFQYTPLLYAEALLKTARFAGPGATFHLPATGTDGELCKRIQFFTTIDSSKLIKEKKLNWLVIPIVLMLILTIAGGRYQFSSHDFQQIPLVNNNSLQQQPLSIKKESPANHSVLNGIRVMYIPAEVKSSAARHPVAKAKPAQPALTKSDVAAATPVNEQKPESINSISPAGTMYPDYQVVQASSKEKQQGKDYIIREEDPATGTIVTKAYRIEFKNEQWKSQFLWMTTETRPLPDSLRIRPDSLMIQLQ